MKQFNVIATLETPFQVDALREVSAPDGGTASWYQYEISQGTNKITGLRPGGRAEVAHELQLMVARLNERRSGKKAK